MTLTSAWEAEVEEPEASEETRGVHVLPRREPPRHHWSPPATALRRAMRVLFWVLVGVVVYLVVGE